MNSSDKILPPYNIDTFFKKRLGFEMRKIREDCCSEKYIENQTGFWTV